MTDHAVRDVETNAPNEAKFEETKARFQHEVHQQGDAHSPRLSASIGNSDNHLPLISLSSELKSSSASNALPGSRMEKAQVVLTEAAKAVPSAVGDALFGVHWAHVPMSESIAGHDLSLPVPKIAESAAAGAAIGFTVKTLLPSTGILGKIGGAALAAAFTAPLAKEGLNIYHGINDANSLSDLRKAGHDLGTLTGNLAANLPLGYAGYKAGAYASDQLLSTQLAKGFVDAKTTAYNKANDYVEAKVDGAANYAKNLLLGERSYPGSHSVVEKLTLEELSRMDPRLTRGIMGSDYKLPTEKLPEGVGKNSSVVIATGHGVEAPELTEVYRVLKDAGVDVKVASPDWTWKYQPGNEGQIAVARWEETTRAFQTQLSFTEAQNMVAAGKVDAVYVPGGAGNTASIRTDGDLHALLQMTHDKGLDIWTICHGGDVITSSHVFPKGTKMTGSPDIRPDNLKNAGFDVPADNVPVVFDANQRLLSGQDPNALDSFIREIGQRLRVIEAAKTNKSETAVHSNATESTAPSITANPNYPVELGGTKPSGAGLKEAPPYRGIDPHTGEVAPLNSPGIKGEPDSHWQIGANGPEVVKAPPAPLGYPPELGGGAASVDKTFEIPKSPRDATIEAERLRQAKTPPAVPDAAGYRSGQAPYLAF